MIEPGYYRINMENASYSELYRIGGFLMFPFSVIMKWTGKKNPQLTYLPDHVNDQQVNESELDNMVLDALNAMRNSLGNNFQIVAWQKNKKTINSDNEITNGGLFLTDCNDTVVHLIYAKMKNIKMPSIAIDNKAIHCISFSDSLDTVITSTNLHKRFDSPKHIEQHYIQSKNPLDVYCAHKKTIKRHSNLAKTIETDNIISKLDMILDASNEYKISRGLYEKVA